MAPPLDRASNTSSNAAEEHETHVGETRVTCDLTRLPVLTDAGLAVLVQAETPAAKALKGAGAVLARVLAAAVHSQTLVDI